MSGSKQWKCEESPMSQKTKTVKIVRKFMNLIFVTSVFRFIDTTCLEDKLE